jgi:Ca2+-binding RTX toxin-like protein
VLDGGAGFDLARYDYATQGVWASLDNPAMNTGEAAGDTYIGIEGLVGSKYSDVLVGDGGRNELYGGDGNDLLVGGVGADLLDGGNGFDTASYFSATTGVTAHLDVAGLNTGDAAGDTYIGIENLDGSEFDDVLYGDNGWNVLVGRNGNDRLFGLDGNDTLLGGKDADHLFGGVGADYLDGGGDFDLAHYDEAKSSVTAVLFNPLLNAGEAGGDIYVGIEGLVGSNFNDILVGDAGANELRGLDNDDTLVGGEGADLLDGGFGSHDTASYFWATAGVTARLDWAALNAGEAAGDTYIRIENLDGSEFPDMLVGDGGANVLSGRNGNDMLVGLGGINILYGEDGDDHLWGGEGPDELWGGAGFDYARYDAATAGVTALLDSPFYNTGDAAGDTYFDIEGLVGSNFDDSLSGANDLFGRGGDDLLIGGRPGVNRLFGGEGADELFGGDSVTLDLACYDQARAGVRASLDDPAGNKGEAAGDTYSEIDGLVGSASQISWSGTAMTTPCAAAVAMTS